MHWLADFPNLAGRALGRDSRLFDKFDKRPRRAIADGRFVGIHFDEGIVDTHAAERGDHVFDGVDLDGALGQGSGTLNGLDLFHIRADEWLVGQIDATKLQAVALWCRAEG